MDRLLYYSVYFLQSGNDLLLTKSIRQSFNGGHYQNVIFVLRYPDLVV